MTSIRLETKRLEFDGRVWEISCNMAVLDALQTAHGGDFSACTDQEPMRAIPELLAFMLNDYAEDQGWEIRYTPKQVARKLPFGKMLDLDLMGMFWRAVSPAADEPPSEAAQEAAADPGN